MVTGVLLTLQLLFTPRVWAADGAPSSELHRATAQALFEAGRELMQTGRYAEACPKLAESARLDETASTRLNLALCNEKLGRSASAWVNYKDALALAVQDHDEPRAAIARERLATLEPQLSRLHVTLAGSSPAGSWLTLDGIQLGAQGLGTPLPVDPGVHWLRAGAPGWSEVQARVQVLAGVAVQRVELPTLQRAPTPAAPAKPARESRARLVLAGTSLGIGVAGLASTALFGLEAKQAWDRRNAACRNGCNADAKDADEHARAFAWAADASLAVGLLGLGLGGYLLWTAPQSQGVAVGVTGNGQASFITASGRL